MSGRYRLREAALIVIALLVILNLPYLAPMWRLVVLAAPALIIGALPLIGLGVVLDVAVLNGNPATLARRGRSLAFRAGLVGIILGTVFNFLIFGAMSCTCRQSTPFC